MGTRSRLPAEREWTLRHIRQSAQVMQGMSEQEAVGRLNQAATDLRNTATAVAGNDIIARNEGVPFFRGEGDEHGH